MTGLEKITSEIKADAEKTVAAIIDKANTMFLFACLPANPLLNQLPLLESAV